MPSRVTYRLTTKAAIAGVHITGANTAIIPAESDAKRIPLAIAINSEAHASPNAGATETAIPRQSIERSRDAMSASLIYYSSMDTVLRCRFSSHIVLFGWQLSRRDGAAG
jgi:hypothetical protein